MPNASKVPTVSNELVPTVSNELLTDFLEGPADA
jgi:hypothetical protein